MRAMPISMARGTVLAVRGAATARPAAGITSAPGASVHL